MPHVLTLPRAHTPPLPESGFWTLDNLDFLQHAHWQDRAQAEHNEVWLQPIAYLLLRNAAGHIWCYQRTGGDARLDGRCSCGVGGHVDLADAEPPFYHNPIDSSSCPSDMPYRPISPLNPLATLRHTLLRELTEELGAHEADVRDLCFQGLIYEGLSAVGRVHLGVMFTAQWLPAQVPQPVAGESLLGLGFRPAIDIANNQKFELWSRMAAQCML